MRIAEIALDGNGAWPDLRARSIADGLTVFFGPPGTGKSTVASFVGHVLYGRQPANPWQSASSTRTHPEGELIVQSRGGRYRLRRYNDVAPPGRLTVSSLDGQAVDSHTVEKLLSGGSATVISHLYLADFSRADGLDRLLTSEFAQAFRASLGSDGHHGETDHAPNHSGTSVRSLLNRRDQLAHELESRLASGRQQSRELEDRFAELDALRRERSQEATSLRERLQVVEATLAEVEARCRYGQLESQVQIQQSSAVPTDLDARLAEVDEQIDRWRSTLADLERREAAVQARLTQLHPDDVAGELPLADQRAHLGVMRRLATDLEGELARLARAAEPQSQGCVCREAHQRLRPIAETLANQMSLLDRSLAEQERVAEYLDLRGEAEHLERSKNELHHQLNHLLDRRQVLIRTGRPTRRRATANNGAISLADGQEDLNAEDLASRRRQLEKERAELHERLASADQSLSDLTHRCDGLARDRANLLSGASIEQLRAELAALDAQLQGEFAQAANLQPGSCSAGALRASDYLAQLSSGDLVQLRQHHRDGTAIVRRDGTHVPLAELRPAERTLAYLALTLSLVAAHSRRGTTLPLILDEPFDELNERQIVSVATVLHEFGRSGHQLLVLTRCSTAIERFQSQGSEVRGMHELRCASDADVELRPLVATAAGRPEPSAAGSIRTPVTSSPKLPAAARDDSFHLRVDDPIGVFPALGADTSPAFAAAGIHTVGDLIEAAPEQVAALLQRESINAAVVRLWQTHQVLMCFVPDVSLEDAQVLTGAGVYDLEDLLHTPEKQLQNRLRSYLESPQGKRFRDRGYWYDSRRLGTWRRGLEQWYQRWENSRQGSRWRKQVEAHRRTRSATNHPPHDQQQANSQTSRPARPEQPATTVHRGSPVVDAPSIGPKTARRLKKVGIRTVDDLLFANADEVAEQLDVRHITAEKVAIWQQQAHLVCELPRLRSHDAQILVACGFTDIQAIAEKKAGELLSLVLPFCESSEGERILRGSHKPDEAECGDWIAWARQRNSLEAA